MRGEPFKDYIAHLRESTRNKHTITLEESRNLLVWKDGIKFGVTPNDKEVLIAIGLADLAV